MYANSCIWVHRTDVCWQPSLSRRRKPPEIHEQTLKKTEWWWQAMARAPQSISFPCALALPPPSHGDATMPSPCWAPHFMPQEHIMFSNPTLSEPRICPAATMSDHILSALTLLLHWARILQPATPPQVVAFESWTISAPICVFRLTFAELRTPDLWTCVCAFTFFLLYLCFSDRNKLQLQVPVCNLVVITTAIPPLLWRWYSFLAVSQILNHSDTCSVPSVCNTVGLLILFKLCPRLHLSSTDDVKRFVSYLHVHLFSNIPHRHHRVSPRRSMYLLIVGSDYCVMRFAYALHMRHQNLLLFCLYTEPFELIIEIVFHYLLVEHVFSSEKEKESCECNTETSNPAGFEQILTLHWQY